MGGSYKRCPACSSRALSIATRCPGCGGEFPPAEEAGGTSGGFRAGGGSGSRSGAILVLAVVGILVASRAERTGGAWDRRSSLGAVVPGAAPAEVGVVDSGVAAASAPPSSVPDTAVAFAAPADASVAVRLLVAHRVIHVMKARGRNAPLEAVLEPGDTLAVDSLVGEWYRVTFEGAVMGYTERAGVDSSTAPGGGRLHRPGGS